MKIIGAGFGRTGTMSLSVALEQLGFGPCYHFIEFFKKPGHIRHWQAAADGQPVDWQTLLSGYQSGLDYQFAAFYKEILPLYPDAKVILTVREPEKWYQSNMETIYQGTALPSWFLRLAPPFRGLEGMIRDVIWDGIFDGRFEDREYTLGVFQDHIEEVKSFVPSERLLVFHPADGWEPLCAFLDVPAPDGPFPHVNDRQMTKRMFRTSRVVLPLVLLGILALLTWLLAGWIG